MDLAPFNLCRWMDSLGLVFLALLSSRWISPCYVQPLDLFLDPTVCFPSFLSGLQVLAKQKADLENESGSWMSLSGIQTSRIRRWVSDMRDCIERRLIHLLISFRRLLASARVSEGNSGRWRGLGRFGRRFLPEKIYPVKIHRRNVLRKSEKVLER